MLATQALRLFQHFIGADLKAGSYLLLLGASLPAILAASLPFAITAGLALALARDQREVVAMQLAGASPSQLLRGQSSLIIGCALLGGLAAGVVAPRTNALLYRKATELASAALIARAEPTLFHRLAPGLTLYCGGRRLSNEHTLVLTRLFVALEAPLASQPLELFARRATLATERSVLRFQLEEGEVHQSLPAGGLRRTRFARLSYQLDLEQALARHLAFLARAPRPLTAALGVALACVALALLALGSALQLPKARDALLVTFGLAMMHELARALAGSSGGLAVSALLASAMLLYLHRCRRRGN